MFETNAVGSGGGGSSSPPPSSSGGGGASSGAAPGNNNASSVSSSSNTSSPSAPSTNGFSPTSATSPGSGSTTGQNTANQEEINFDLHRRSQPNQDSVGFKELRGQKDALDKDIREKYQPVVKEVTRLGGIEEFKSLASLKEQYVLSTDREATLNVLEQLYQWSPASFESVIDTIADTYADRALEIIAQKRGYEFLKEANTQSDPLKQKWEQINNTYELPEDHELSTYVKELQEENARLKNHTKESLTQTARASNQQTQQQRVERFNSKVFADTQSAINEAITKMQLTAEEQEQLQSMIYHYCRKDTDNAETFERYKTLAADGREIPHHTLVPLQEWLNNATALAIRDMNAMKMGRNPQQLKSAPSNGGPRNIPQPGSNAQSPAERANGRMPTDNPDYDEWALTSFKQRFPNELKNPNGQSRSRRFA